MKSKITIINIILFIAILFMGWKVFFDKPKAPQINESINRTIEFSEKEYKTLFFFNKYDTEYIESITNNIKLNELSELVFIFSPIVELEEKNNCFIDYSMHFHKKYNISKSGTVILNKENELVEKENYHINNVSLQELLERN